MKPQTQTTSNKWRASHMSTPGTRQRSTLPSPRRKIALRLRYQWLFTKKNSLGHNRPSLDDYIDKLTKLSSGETSSWELGTRPFWVEPGSPEPVRTSCTFSRLFDGEQNGTVSVCSAYNAKLPVNQCASHQHKIASIVCMYIDYRIAWASG